MQSTWHFVQDQVGDIAIIKKGDKGYSTRLQLEGLVIGVMKSELRLGSTTG